MTQRRSRADPVIARLVRLALDDRWCPQAAALALRSEFVDQQLESARARLNCSLGGRQGVFAKRAMEAIDAAFAATPQPGTARSA